LWRRSDQSVKEDTNEDTRRILWKEDILKGRTTFVVGGFHPRTNETYCLKCWEQEIERIASADENRSHAIQFEFMERCLLASRPEGGSKLVYCEQCRAQIWYD
jgi:hypothetical protein